jgi:hypothetical protein
MTVPVAIKHEKATEAGPFRSNNLRPFSRESPMTLRVTTLHENRREREYCVSGLRPESGRTWQWCRKARKGV